MQLPSGITVTDEELRALVDSMVSEYVSYDFEDWNSVIHIHTESLAEDDLVDGKPLENEEDRAAVMGAVEPVAKAFADELAVEYGKLYEKHVGNRTW